MTRGRVPSGHGAHHGPVHSRRLPNVSGGVAAAVGELQRLKCTVVAGAAADANIAVAGIATTDTLLAVHRHIDSGAATTAAVVDHTAQASINSAGNIRVSVQTNVNAGDRLVVWWFDKSA